VQLQFTREELKLLAEVLEHESAVCTDRLKKASYELLDRVIAHDLGLAFDELEDLQEILQRYERALLQLLQQATPEALLLLVEKECRLQKIKDKVTEACAMV
jgi:predicted transcriptional regulator